MKTHELAPVSKTLGWGLKMYRPLFKQYLRRSWKIEPISE